MSGKLVTFQKLQCLKIKDFLFKYVYQNQGNVSSGTMLS